MKMRMMKENSVTKLMIINSDNPLVENSAAIDLEWLPFEGEYSHDKTDTDTKDNILICFYYISDAFTLK